MNLRDDVDTNTRTSLAFPSGAGRDRVAAFLPLAPAYSSQVGCERIAIGQLRTLSRRSSAGRPHWPPDRAWQGRLRAARFSPLHQQRALAGVLRLRLPIRLPGGHAG